MALKNVLPLIAILYVVGCTSEHQDITDLVQYVETQQKITPPQKVEDLPWFRFQQDITVDAEKLSNPFVDTATLKTKSAKPLINSRDALKPDLKRNKMPLEAFKLSDLDFLGVIAQSQELWAIISNIDTNATSIVKVGDYLGKHYGRIIKITPKEIDLDQRIQSHDGTWVQKIATLQLQANENA